jgi:G:T-mismatch repair DNA endonuclease (very short patch repair protein)
MPAWPNCELAQDRAWRRHNAAKGLVIRARREGSAEKIAAAVERERQAYAEFDRISGAVIEEMFKINGAPG